MSYQTWQVNYKDYKKILFTICKFILSKTNFTQQKKNVY